MAIDLLTLLTLRKGSNLRYLSTKNNENVWSEDGKPKCTIKNTQDRNCTVVYKMRKKEEEDTNVIHDADDGGVYIKTHRLILRG